MLDGREYFETEERKGKKKRSKSKRYVRGEGGRKASENEQRGRERDG